MIFMQTFFLFPVLSVVHGAMLRIKRSLTPSIAGSQGSFATLLCIIGWN
jgi:hypothetical protein